MGNVSRVLEFVCVLFLDVFAVHLFFFLLLLLFDDDVVVGGGVLLFFSFLFSSELSRVKSRASVTD